MCTMKECVPPCLNGGLLARGCAGGWSANGLAVVGVDIWWHLHSLVWCSAAMVEVGQTRMVVCG